MTERDRFYQERDRRTRDYGLADRLAERPVAIIVGDDAADCPRGQMLVLALVNIAARFHRNLILLIPDRPVENPRLGGRVAMPAGIGLFDAASLIASAIDPYVTIQARLSERDTASIGIGTKLPCQVPWTIGAQNNFVELSNSPIAADKADGFSLGSLLAACTAAGVLYRQLVDARIELQRFSSWNLRTGDDALDGPASLGPLDVGQVLMVGAGGVGSCLAYLLGLSGVVNRWQVVDGDRVELHNTNRALGMLPSDAGWPDGGSKRKAVVAAELLDAEPIPRWYDELEADQCRADLVLPLANERGVRTAVSQRGEPILLHASTSSAFEAQVHRNIAGRDDCLLCRLPPNSQSPEFVCATGRIETTEGSSDAALSFLSATAAVLLQSSLYRLMHGELEGDKLNWWRVAFHSCGSLLQAGRRQCSIGCPGILSPKARLIAHGHSRWTHLDETAHTQQQPIHDPSCQNEATAPAT